MALSGASAIEPVEGAAPIDEAIDYLRRLAPLEPLNFSASLYKAANLQLDDLILNSVLRHIGRDGSNLASRLKKFGTGGTIYAENITSLADTPRAIVLMMIIDDGVKNRIHRKNIFNPNFRVAGIAFGKNKTGRAFCVINFADRFFETNPKSGVRRF